MLSKGANLKQVFEESHFKTFEFGSMDYWRRERLSMGRCRAGMMPMETSKPKTARFT